MKFSSPKKVFSSKCPVAQYLKEKNCNRYDLENFEIFVSVSSRASRRAPPPNYSPIKLNRDLQLVYPNPGLNSHIVSKTHEAKHSSLRDMTCVSVLRQLACEAVNLPAFVAELASQLPRNNNVIR